MALSTSAGPISMNSSIKVKNETVNYRTYDVQSTADPENTVGDVGDLYRDGLGRVWVKGKPIGYKGKTSSRGNKPRWVVPTTVRGRKSKAKETHQAQKCLREEDEEDELEAEIIGNK
ncbi:hypothetical protein PILCRDRAFT_92535 [Piloderma croceum F 1598]|uniref:Uncharacterized protein n=1 Tax=Piloderma croceum (strain F 1598) TaxID=765440 RepID=A0A0C3F3X8_PILCF|nr:hypothetical protein PILCRDRAFT_92535 [Piloderma croceum F 1598]